ncbi:ParB/RepB/Spo0J family partition protein [Candidatus Igneacidithiobacillus taiwanensis]|uniref:ParB/RepB/Spo0J family partition protein n=1 Tax=Candidatus Igneacidithiobacillus taiwanensis TaxID=1945924 RepID=UPI0028A07633|nr:ParB/RepB/Spo0J family partition protein [Candidatus Igneacidithiobacillus taiwanensis]
MDDVLAALEEVAQTDYGNLLDESRTPAVSLFIPLDEIEPDPEQPRKFSDAEALQDLANSILQHGVIQPITVRRNGDKYQIVTGERRWKASNLALETGEPCQRKGYDLSRIPAVIIEPETETDRLEIQLVENLARADMSDEDTANALKTLYENLGLSFEAIGKRIGRSKKWVISMLARIKPEAQEIADILGIPLADIGNNELIRLISWHKDCEKAPLLQAVAARLRSGDSFSRSLLNEAEEQFKLENRLGVSGLPLDDLRALDREVAKGNMELLESVKAQATPDLQAARESLIAAKVAAQRAEAEQVGQGGAAEAEQPTAEQPAAKPKVVTPTVIGEPVTATPEPIDDDDNVEPTYGNVVNTSDVTDYSTDEVGPDFGDVATIALAHPAVITLRIPQDLADRIADAAGKATPATAEAVLEALQEHYG